MGALGKDALDIAADIKSNLWVRVVEIALVAGLLCPGTWWFATLYFNKKIESLQSAASDRTTSIALEVQNPPGQIEVVLDGEKKKLTDNGTGFVRFEGITGGRHHLRYSYQGHVDGLAFIDIGVQASPFFVLPALHRKSEISTAGKMAVSRPPDIPSSEPLQRLVARDITSSPPISVRQTSNAKDKCCWIFLGTFKQRLTGVMAGADATISVESGVPRINESFVLKSDVMLRELSEPENGSPFLGNKSMYQVYQGNRGLLKSGTVIRVIEINGDPMGYAPFWGRVEVFKN